MAHEIKRTYRYCLYPNEAQKAELARVFGCSRWVYNWALETKTKAYYQDEEPVGFADLSRRLTQQEKSEETEWLQEVSAVTLQQSLRTLNQASTNFFEGRAEYPSFTSKKGDQTARYVGTAFDIREDRSEKTEAIALAEGGSSGCRRCRDSSMSGGRESFRPSRAAAPSRKTLRDSTTSASSAPRKPVFSRESTEKTATLRSSGWTWASNVS